MSCWGTIVLNAELKSMNNILTYESLVSRCVRAEWRAVEIASLVGGWTGRHIEMGPGWRGEMLRLHHWSSG